MSRIYQASEVARHNNAKDLWIVYKDGVYDITKFYQEHPGGEEVLLDLAGKDATKCFDEVGHTIEAIQLRETYKIGTVVGTLAGQTTASGGVQDTTIDDENWHYEPPKYETSPWLRPFAVFCVLLYAAIIYWTWLS